MLAWTAECVLKGYKNGVVKTFGMAAIDESVGDFSTACTCFVVPTRLTSLFCQDIIQQLNLLSIPRLYVYVRETSRSALMLNQKLFHCVDMLSHSVKRSAKN